jgi:hypothetical protein
MAVPTPAKRLDWSAGHWDSPRRRIEVAVADQGVSMAISNRQMVSPVGTREFRHESEALRILSGDGDVPVVGLLNNSKPNVDFFLDALKTEILAQGKGYATFGATKPRSAGPCPDLDALAKRCDFVINAVAD